MPGRGHRRRRLAHAAPTARSARSVPASARPTSPRCLAFGEFWQAVPGTIRVEFTGEKRRFVTGKDLILARDRARSASAAGRTPRSSSSATGADALSIDERLAVANMAVEAGAETGFFPADETTAAYLEGRTDRPWAPERSDPDAEFAQRAADRPRRARAADRAAAPARQRRRRQRRGRHARSTRSTSATAPTAR